MLSPKPTHPLLLYGIFYQKKYITNFKKKFQLNGGKGVVCLREADTFVNHDLDRDVIWPWACPVQQARL